MEPGIPESFNVLVNEMKSLGLNVEMFESSILTEEVTDENEEDNLMRDLLNFFDKPKDPLALESIRISIASPESDPKMELWGGKKTGNDQLQYF